MRKSTARDTRRQNAEPVEHENKAVDQEQLAGMPAMQPLAMPVQDLGRRPDAPRASQTQRVYRWRAAIVASSVLLTAAFAYESYEVLAVGSLTLLQIVFLVFSVVAFSWIAFGTVNTVAGFLTLFRNQTGDTIALPDKPGKLVTKTALLFPIYHEEPLRIAAVIQAISEELEQLGASQQFDVFVLSDTRDAEAGRREQAVFGNLSKTLGGRPGVYYRRRTDTTAKKVGNIANWITRHGGGYEHFIIFDADSIMTGDAIVRLALAMERTPKAGLIQSAPQLTGGQTLFARLQEFATAVYGQMVSAGLAVWHGSQANYWGHNAIIRTRAFASAAGLPELTGRRPFGGHIQSHDFAEAALIQRAGWEVHLVPSLAGSFEGCPPSAVDFSIRDRRWCQGNLQHMKLVARRGLTAMSRVHLGMGIASYLISPVWCATLVLGLVLALQSEQFLPTYFTDETSLFPHWPVIDAAAALHLFAATMAIVLLPKLLGFILLIKQSVRRTKFTYVAKTAVGILIETVYSALFAPFHMVTQTIAVAGIILGRDSGWIAQRRDDGAISFRQVGRLYGIHSFIGVTVLTISFCISYALMGWMAPVYLGLCLAAVLSWSTARSIPAWLEAYLNEPSRRQQPPILSRIKEIISNQ